MDARIRRRLKLRDLDTLMTVVRSGSMAKAAKQLSLSQPAVSKAIADLEHTLGVRVLDRTGQGVEATLYGNALMKWATAMFDDLRQGMNEISFLTDPTVGELRIGATEPVVAGILPAILSRLSRSHPRLTFHIIQIAAGADQVRNLKNRTVDVLLGRVTPVIKQDENLGAEMLFEEPLFVVAGVNNPLARRRNLQLSELMAEPWTLPHPDTMVGSLVRDTFRANGFDPPTAGVVCNSIQMHNGLVADGRHLAMYPRSVLHFAAKRLSIKVLPVKLPIIHAPVGIVTLKNRTSSPIAQLFIAAAQESAAPLSGEALA